MKSFSHESGSVLLLSLVCSVLLFGFSASIAFFSVTSARTVSESTDKQIAFYLAEGGLNASKRELVSQKDVDGDGTGRLYSKDEMGEYDVVVTDLGNGFFQIASTGTSKNLVRTTLTELAELIPQTTFPDGAISIVGDVDKEKIKIDKHAGLILDGGDDAALAFNDQNLYEELAEEFAKAILDNKIPASNITGGITNTIEVDGVDVEISASYEELDPGYEDEILGVYTELLNAANSLLPLAQVEEGELGGGNDVFTFGTAESPAIVHFTEKVEMKQNDRITGYGTLIVGAEMLLKDNSVLDWVGDVIIYSPDESKKSKLEVDKGTLNVTGNVVILGEGSEDVEFKVKEHGTAAINGSLFIGTHNEEDKGKKAKMEIDGTFNLNGLSTMLGRKVEVKFNDKSDTLVNGAMQFAMVDNTGEPEEIKMEFKGDLEIHRDVEQIRQGALALRRLNENLNFPGMQTIVTFDVGTRYWSQQYETGSAHPSSQGELTPA